MKEFFIVIMFLGVFLQWAVAISIIVRVIKEFMKEKYFYEYKDGITKAIKK